MRTVLVVGLLLAGGATAIGQNARGGLAVTVTDPTGVGLEGVEVTLTGPTDRVEATAAGGELDFAGLLAGTYRLSFRGDDVVAFEREVVLEAGQVARVDVVLTVADAPPPATVEVPAAVGPRGTPLTASIPAVLEREFVGNAPRRETPLACSGNTRTTMIQLNAALPPRLYDTADAAYYVVGGAGTATLGDRDVPLQTNDFVSAPRGTPHAFARTGERPLILIAVLSGAPCEEGR